MKSDIEYQAMNDLIIVIRTLIESQCKTVQMQILTAMFKNGPDSIYYERLNEEPIESTRLLGVRNTPGMIRSVIECTSKTRIFNIDVLNQSIEFQ